MENGNNNFTETQEFLPGFPTVDHFNQGLFEKFVKATKTANALPKADEFKYFSTVSTFRSHMDEFGQRILNLMQNFLTKEAGEKAPIINDFEDADEVSDNFEIMTDVVDSLLEKVDSFADEVKGALPKPSIVIAKAKTPPSTGKRVDLQVFAGANIPRPQLKFEEPVNNTNSPFIPKLKSKPNAIIPLEHSMHRDMVPKLSSEMESHITNLGLRPDDDQSPHPYEYEILSFQYMPSQLLPSKPQIHRSLEETPFTFIKSSSQLYTLAKRLESEPEIAIDLESHSYRSFQGFTCLMQVSTRTEDFLIDCIELRSHMQILNTSFTNPKIVKILHGADSDVTWLQRDFSIYLVNMFDTGQASRVLEFPKFSLAYLLSHYCKVNVDKKYQLADWRIRPIPDEMIKYAREDTHYLLYIYDLMKNELIQRGNQSNNLLLAVLNRSRDLCLKRYEKERLTETSHLVLYNKFNWLFNPQQMRVFAAMYAWRDRLSRSEDESTRYILPNHMLSRISEVLPTDVGGLYACCNPVPPFVKLYSSDILSIIAEAKKEPSAQIAPSYLPQYSTIPQPQPRSVNISGNLTNINPNANVSHSEGHSPVLTTEQLYATAGWVESTPLSKSSRSTAVFSTRQNNIQPMGMSFDSSSEDEDEEDIQSKKTASLIHSSLSQELFSIPLQTFVFEPETKTQGTPVEPEKNPVEKVVKITEEVPKSISDIYKLSNQIKRKRSKDKGKKDDKMNEDESEDEGKTKRAKGQAERDASNSSEFMKEIGWIDKQEDVPLKGKSNSSNQEQKQSSNKGNKQNAPSKEKTSKFTPFDYNSVQQPQRSQNNQREEAFNPYSKPQSPDFQKKGNQGNRNVKPQTGNRSLTFRPKGNSGNNQNWPRK